MGYDTEDDYEETNKTPMIIMALLGIALIAMIILLIVSGNKNNSLSDDLTLSKQSVVNMTAQMNEMNTRIVALTSEKSVLSNTLNQKDTEKQTLIADWNQTNFTLDAVKLNLTKALKKVNDTIKGFDFLEIAKTIANNHTWFYNGSGNASNYVCTNFSRDLVKSLNLSGWKAETVEGYWFNNITTINGTIVKNCSQSNYERFNCSHMWVYVKIPIEATTGKIIFPELNETYVIA